MQENESAERLMHIAGLFALDRPATAVRPLGDGLINDTYAVMAGGDEPAYALQRINTAIFTDPALLQRNFRLITAHIDRCLAERGVADRRRRRLEGVATLDGGDYLALDGEAWRMTRYIGGSATYTTVDSRTAELTGRAFGEFHGYFARPDAPALGESIRDFHNLTFRLGQLRQAMAADRAGRLAQVRDDAQWLLSREHELTLHERLHAEGSLPKRIVHCDTKLNNILFDSRSGEILCVIDLDTTMPGFVLSDFGDFIRTAGNRGREDDPEPGHVGLDMEVFRSFARGYVVAAAGFLTDAERALLPYGAQMLTYMQTVRFLTDYLAGDTYYKTAYADHNLVRTRAQMALLRSIDAHLDEMNRYILTL